MQKNKMIIIILLDTQVMQISLIELIIVKPVNNLLNAWCALY